ncbi:acetyl/propionyl/methylcrotonyl-CoA carboxylase subunit alpha [Allonocardiopsis opalescens]|uniref:biotin carboxylase n=1 Tax=Allonocardiopsis opalescens TaxID=1144618 RepID=A0A2T0Q0I2_9ACTN|nr:biotin carboxylase N-terminal domain-containing protein [Allonocardiopsis opalescens]PRX97183.1 acetyl-CoA/propionyl-CoA carboxylase, biotin carboxylase, biotin carboxyl carrier protein [Allonocardiopsis opalescens]
MSSFPFDTVLVANRGEIAVRVIRTLRALGLRSVAVYSAADAQARHVREADAAVAIGPAAAARSYLDAEAILRAAAASGAQAVHPGYGFLSENADFARACAKDGLVFIGPPPAAIEAMGDKVRAKRTAAGAGVPVLPGFAEEPGRPLDGAALAERAAEVGYPLLVKPSAGGGGKGMQVVRGPGELDGAVATARRTALAAFGDATLLVERYLERPRHIEVQVFADAHGEVVHLGERECSLQRRHQKIIEEAPSPLLDAAARAAMGAHAVAAARACGYVGAGTVEFIVPGGGGADEYFFLEMNTRLQVEHPVTELVTGLDLVELQLRVAAGEPLPPGLADRAPHGHAVEARLYAEDPDRGFLPSGGPVLRWREPHAPHVRTDAGIDEGAQVTSDYDPMLAKVVAWGSDRATALRRLDAALAETVLLGLATNLGFLRSLLADPDVRAGALDTGLVERRLAGTRARGQDAAAVPDDVLLAAALERQLALEPPPGAADRFAVPDGWRLGAPHPTRWRFRLADGRTAEVELTGRAAGASAAVQGAGPRRAAARHEGDELLVEADGATTRYARAHHGSTLWIGRDGLAWPLAEQEPLERAAGPGAAADGRLRSPMPGTVLEVRARPGERVAAGQVLVVVEAMKMEHAVTAPIGGVLAEVHAVPGRQVALDAVLALVEPEEPEPGPAAPAGPADQE